MTYCLDAKYKTTNDYTVNSAMQVVVCVVFMVNKYSCCIFKILRTYYIQTEPLARLYTLSLVE